MSALNTTLGPWQINGSHVYGVDPNRELICQVVSLNEDRNLIAAAHDLFEAASAIERRANELGGDFDAIPRDELNALLSGALSDALAKARGEAK